jgi:23S rRNA (pseudouridine1915-N3)-methyltransferase
MKIILFNIGRTQDDYLKEGIALYEKRIRHYIPLELVYLQESRQNAGPTPKLQKEAEAGAVLNALEKIDFPVLLDERGKSLSSPGLAQYIQQAMNRGTKSMGFVIGGAYGFTDEVYKKVPERISLSFMTFPHQLIRLLFLEQLYRSFTIIRGEQYHHD